MNDAAEITIFDRILSGEIKCNKIFEDEHTFAFHDIQPKAPVHALVIPKIKIARISECTEAHELILGRLLLSAKKVAEILDIHKSGYRLVMNDGDNGGQTVSYLHCHVLGGRSLKWPPG